MITCNEPRVRIRNNGPRMGIRNNEPRIGIRNSEPRIRIRNNVPRIMIRNNWLRNHKIKTQIKLIIILSTKRRCFWKIFGLWVCYF